MNLWYCKTHGLSTYKCCNDCCKATVDKEVNIAINKYNNTHTRGTDGRNNMSKMRRK